MRRLLLCAVSLCSLSACAVSPGYRAADGQVVPPHVTAYDPVYAGPYAPGDRPYATYPVSGPPYALPIAENSCRVDRGACEEAIHECWTSQTSCADAHSFCEGVQARCGSFY